MNWLKIYL